MVNRVVHYRVAAGIIAGGGVVAYPTEAVWGLGCDPNNAEAVARLLRIKQRPVEKGLILVAADIEQLAPFLNHLTPDQHKSLQAGWPGPLTWLVPDNGAVPPWIRGEFDSVALRVSAHPTVRALCSAFGGPLVSTSANPSAKAPARNALRVRRYFQDQLDYVVPGELGDSAKPSEIRDLLTGEIRRLG